MATRRRSRRTSITGNLTDVQKRLRFLETRPNPSRLASKSVDNRNIKPHAISEDLIADSEISTRTIKNSAVTTDKIGDQNVTTAKLADDSVNSAKIAANAVGTAEIANGSVTTEKIAGFAVTTDKINSSAVTTDKISNSNVTTEKLADLSVTEGKIANGAITSAKLGTSTVQTANIADLNVTTGKIADLAVTEAKLGNNSVTSAKIATDAVGFDEIADNAIFNQNIRSGSVYGRVISRLGISGNTSILNASIDSGDMAADSVGATELKDDAVRTANILNGVVTEAKLAGSAVTTAKINNGAVTGAKIAGSTITSDKITSGASILTTAAAVSPMSVTLGTVTNGTRVTVSIAVGTGANNVAAGNHTHSGGGTVPSHTHPATLSFISGATSANSGTNHQHGYSLISGVTVNAPSSIKFKENIEDYTIDTSKLLNLKLKKYKYKRSYKNMHPNREWMYGYMAEDLLEAGMEEVLGYDKDGNPNSVNYGLLSVFIVELLKEQQNKIDSLTEEVKRLKDKK